MAIKFRNLNSHVACTIHGGNKIIDFISWINSISS
jgi:hypothetical protein